MTEDHKLAGLVKQYLLGTLGAKESATLEEKYFSDATVFRLISREEDRLIRAYLTGHLNSSEREQFEGRYLVVPELSRRVHEIETQIRWRRRRVQFAFAGAFAVLAVGFFFWRSGVHQSVASRGEVASVALAAPAVGLRLTPGVRMSSDKPAVLANPAGKRVTLTLEIPGPTQPADYSVTIARVDPDGHQRPVWSNRVLSAAGPRTQEVAITADSSLLSPGDYIAEIDSVDRVPIEKYLFRVDPPL